MPARWEILRPWWGLSTVRRRRALAVSRWSWPAVPELWLAPAPSAPVVKATGAHRELALFLDQMDQPLAVGLDQDGQPVFADFSFLNGDKGGHVSISGISGVATKTTYALFLLYMLFETDEGIRLLGARAPQTRAMVFAVPPARQARSPPTGGRRLSSSARDCCVSVSPRRKTGSLRTRIPSKWPS